MEAPRQYVYMVVCEEETAPHASSSIMKGAMYMASCHRDRARCCPDLEDRLLPGATGERGARNPCIPDHIASLSVSHILARATA